MSAKAQQSIIRPLVLGLALLNLVIAFVAGDVLYIGRQNAIAQAGLSTQNLSRVLETSLTGTFDKIDLVLKASVDEVQRLNPRDPDKLDRINRYLLQQQHNVPDLTAIRVTDDSGNLIYGAPGNGLGRINYADRDAFRQLRDAPNIGLVISEPVPGKLIAKWLLPLARRVNKPDGSFAGMVIGAIDISYFDKLFQTIDVGRSGSVSLRNAELGLITRPDLEHSVAWVGSKQLSAAFQQALRINAMKGTFTSGTTSLDDVSRTHSYRRFEKYPLYIVVGLAENDYLAAWRQEASVVSTIVLAFVLASAALAFLLLRSWRNMQRSQTKMQRMSQLYSALSLCNQAIVRCATEAELFPQICRDAVDFGGLKMAWIGMLDTGSRRIKPVASFGDGASYLDGIEISIDKDQPLGLGPTGTAAREDTPVWCQDFVHDPRTQPWHQRARKSGWAASACIPLHRFGVVVGALTLYSNTVNAFDQAEQDLLVGMAMDISSALDRFENNAYLKNAQARIEQLAHFDQLTGLPNHFLLRDHFNYALSLAQRRHAQIVVMVLDLDHFKVINDTLGHSTGDQLLVELTRRFKPTLREEDTLSRQSGDEFTFIFPDISAMDAAVKARKLMSTLVNPCLIGAHELVVTASIGIAIYPEDGQDMESLLKNAEAAMYRVKEISHNDFRFFASEMQASSARHLLLSNALHQALPQQFELHYQPQVSIVDGRVIGVEALLRWQHPELGTIRPLEFIPIAESTGLIVSIGEWVLRTAMAQAKAWLDQGLPPMQLAVNVSAVQFRHPNLLKMVTDALAHVGLPPHLLELELTEAAAMDNPAAAVVLMDQLNGYGIRMAIDDFGTGYSSLSYLKRFKVHKLKIDQSFVHDIIENPDDKAIVTAIINMATSLGMQTIAEGVETAGQLAFLRLQGCNEVQGYYFSKPLPADQFAAYVRAVNQIE